MDRVVVLVLFLVALHNLHIQGEEDDSFKTSRKLFHGTNNQTVLADQKRQFHHTIPNYHYPYNYYNYYYPPYYSWYPYYQPYQCPPCPSCECCKCGPKCTCFTDPLTGQKICPPCLPPRPCPCTSDDVIERPAPKPARWPNPSNNLCAPCPVPMCAPCDDTT